MADYYSSSPLPTPAAGTLPYPWITQFDAAQQATFYVNVETQESTWTLPDLNSSSASYQPAPAVDGTRGMSDNMYGGGASTGAAATQSYSSQYNGSSSNGGGEAASFYGSSGTTPQAPGQSTFSDQTQVQYDANGQPIQDGERGLGKVIVGGGVMYMAYKLYKDYQKGKLNENQFKPPSNYGQPSSSQSQYRPQQQQQQYGGYGRDGIAPTPNWDQKPNNAYGGPPPAPYSVGVNSQPYGQSTLSYAQQPPSYPQQSTPDYGSPPIPFNGGGNAQPYGQPPQYDAYQQPSFGGGAPTKSTWGDPRY